MIRRICMLIRTWILLIIVFSPTLILIHIYLLWSISLIFSHIISSGINWSSSFYLSSIFAKGQLSGSGLAGTLVHFLLRIEELLVLLMILILIGIYHSIVMSLVIKILLYLLGVFAKSFIVRAVMGVFALIMLLLLLLLNIFSLNLLFFYSWSIAVWISFNLEMEKLIISNFEKRNSCIFAIINPGCY